MSLPLHHFKKIEPFCEIWWSCDPANHFFPSLQLLLSRVKVEVVVVGLGQGAVVLVSVMLEEVDVVREELVPDTDDQELEDLDEIEQTSVVDP